MSVKEAVIKLRIDTVLGDMNKAINGLQQGLEKGVTKIDIGTSLGKSMSKNLQAFREEYSKFSQLTAGGTQVKVGNSKEAIQSGEKLIKVYRDIQAQIESMGGTTTENLKKLFPESFDGRIKEVRNSLVSLQSSMLALDVKQTALTEATNEAARLKGELDGLNGQLVDTKDKIAALENAEKALAAASTDQTKAEESLRKVSASAEQTKTKFEQLRQEFVQKIDLNAAGVKKEIDGIEKEINDLITKREQLNKAGDGAGAAKIQKDIDAKSKVRDRKNTEYKKLTEASVSAMNAKDLKALSKQTQFAGVNPKQIEESKAQVQALTQEQIKAAEQVRAAEQAVANAKLKTKDATDQQKSAKDALDAANNKNAKTQTDIERTTKAYEQQTNKVNQLTTEITNMQTKMSTKGMADLKDLIPGFDEARLRTTTGIQGIIADLQTMDDQKAEKVRQEIEKIAIGADTAETQIEEMRGAFRGMGDATAELTRAQKDLDMLKSRLEYFFGITNSVMLFRRAVTKALNTIKELDKTMTEAAVVTEFDVGDMWDRLPEYSKEAQRLGVSINGMYQATTLYYQQGLKTNAAMELGVETMKMAKIAGIESADATKAMTAALRGFNMELNETSATRVNDVYSQLAAVTAADTAQISTAMEKTASIAASANMEFETTAALLAQIIETTQEAPETAGTAMKTIIARFAEVKSLREKGLTSGQDEGGEGIDVNKIQAALRTVGISMEGFFSGTEGLDSILLKLAEKWSTLDFETQRYIATMAAGSRQQSRFIAMMSDYGRTTELVGEAQNSAGASQRQFQKTLDSMESKLQRLKNAWDRYLMGLTNNEILKVGVDALTLMLETINKITDAISGGNGLMKAIVSLTTVLGTLQLGRTLLPSVLGSVGGMMGIGNKTTYTYDKDNNLVSKSVTTRRQVENGPVSQRGGIGAAINRKKEGGKFWQRELTDSEMVIRRRGAITTNKDWGATKKAFLTGAKNDPHYAKIAAQDAIRANNKNFTNKEMGAINKAFDDTYKSSKDYNKAMDAMAHKTNELGGTMKDANGNVINFSKGIKNTTFDTQALGQMAMGAGAAVGGLAAILNATGSEDCQELAKGLSVASAVLFGLGAISNFVVPILKKGADALILKGWETWAAWSWMIAIVVVIAAVAAAFVLLKKAADEASDEKRLEKLTQVASELGEAAEKAKEKLEGIAAARKSLEEMQGTFKHLTKGTDEWRKALIENNQQVLNLLDTYPELSKYLDRGANGELVIRPEGWTEIEQQQLDLYTNLTTSKLAIQDQMEATKQRIQTKEALDENGSWIGATRRKRAEMLNSSAGAWGAGLAMAGSIGAGALIGTLFGGPLGALIGAGIGGLGSAAGFITTSTEKAERKQTGGLSLDEYERFAATAAEKGLNVSNGTLDENAINEIFNEMKVSNSAEEMEKFRRNLAKMGSDFDELAIQTLALKEAERARLEVTIDSILAGSDLVTNTERFSEYVKDAIADQNEGYSEEVVKEAEVYLKTLENGNKKSQNELYKQYAEMAGLGDAKQVRAKVDKGDISDTEIAYALATDEKNKKIIQTGEKLTAALLKMENREDSMVQAVSKLISTEGRALTKEDLDVLGYIDSEFTSENIVERLGYTDAADPGLKEFYTALGLSDLGALVDYFNKNAGMAYKVYSKALKNMEEVGIKSADRLAKLSSEATKGIVENAQKVFVSGATTEDVNTMLGRAISFVQEKGLDDNTQDKLLEYLATADWSSTESLDQTQVLWADALDENTEGLNTLFDSIEELTDATSQLTLAMQMERGFQREELLQKIASGEIDQYNLDAETKKVLEQFLNLGEFIQVGTNKWMYSGDAYSEIYNQQEKTGGRMSGTAARQIKGFNWQTAYQYEADQSGRTSGLSEMKIFTTDWETLTQAAEGNEIVPGVAFQSQLTTTSNGLSHVQSEFGKELENQFASGIFDVDVLWDKLPDKTDYFYGKEDFVKEFNTYKNNVFNNAGNFSTKTTSTFSTADAVNEILSKASLWKEKAESGDEDEKYLRDVLTQAWKDTGKSEEDIKEISSMTIDELFQALGEVDKEFDVQKYGEFTTDQAKMLGSGVAATSGFVTEYEYGLSEEDKEGLRTAGKTEDEIIALERQAKDTYEKTIETMYDAYGASAFDDIIGKKGMDMSKEESQFAVKAVAVDVAKTEEKLKGFAASVNELSEVFEEGDKNSTEYKKAIAKMQVGLANSLGVDSDLVRDNVSEADLEKIASGDKDVFNRVAETIFQAQLDALENVVDGQSVYSKVKAVLSDEVITEEEMLGILEMAYGGLDKIPVEMINKNKDGAVEITKAGFQTGLTVVHAAGTSVKEGIAAGGGMIATGSNVDLGAMFAKSLAGLGGKKGGNEWENPFDKFYNTYEKINALLREREKLERQYDKILNNRSKTSKELIQNSKEQLANLAEQKKLQEYLQSGKLQEIDDLMSKNSKYSKYVTSFDSKTGTISINWDEIEKIKDSDKGSKVEGYLSKLEELRDQWQEAQDTLEEIEDNTEEIKKEGRDGYLELENRLKDALVDRRQKEIDKLNEINESINDTNSKLLESMQQQIDEYRQNRDNQKTEQELEDRQRRLAYLQQDTSGANAIEILSLQKEIEEGQESYTDQLIDQKISELQKQNDEAAEQRQRQIDLLQAQLDYDEENGKFWPEVSRIMNDVISGNSAFAIQLLQDAEGYKGMSEEQKQDFNDEFSVQQKNSAHYEAMKNLPEEKETKEEALGSGKIASLPSSTRLATKQIKDLQAGLNELYKDGHLGLSKNLDVDGIYGPKTKEAVKLLQRKIGSSADGIWGPNTRSKFLGSNLSSYKTGGLADFTGPAWLDGTKSKPEYILNADQTKAFFTLVDVLSGLTSRSTNPTEKSGDNMYDIDINVESIGSDYDVEQLANKIKSLINEDARYRNNNAINLMR